MRAFEEERDGVVLDHRREIVLQLAGDPQRFATGDDEPQRRSGRGEVGQRSRGVRQELLEVVEHDVGLLFAHARGDRRGVVARRAEIPRDRREERVPRPGPAPAGRTRCRRRRPLRAGVRARARTASFPSRLGPTTVKTQGCARARQRSRRTARALGRARGGRRQRNRSGSAEWWKVVGAELMEMYGTARSLAASAPSCDGKLVDQRLRGVRQDDQMAMVSAATRAPRWTSTPTYPSEVASVGSPVWRPIRTLTGPPSSASAGRHRRRDGARCSREGDEERVPLGVDLDAALRRERLAYSERHAPRGPPHRRRCEVRGAAASTPRCP